MKPGSVKISDDVTIFVGETDCTMAVYLVDRSKYPETLGTKTTIVGKGLYKGEVTLPSEVNRPTLINIEGDRSYSIIYSTNGVEMGKTDFTIEFLQ